MVAGRINRSAQRSERRHLGSLSDRCGITILHSRGIAHVLARSRQLSLASDSDNNTSSFVIQTVASQQASDQRLDSR